MKSTTRKGIEHLYHEKYSMSPKDFIDIVKWMKDESKFIINKETTSITEKADGVGIRFGMNEDNKFFLESSRSGPQYDYDSFSKYAEQKNGKSNTISRSYDDIFKQLKDNKIVNGLLKRYNRGGIKIVGECFYLPNGIEKDDDDKLIKFVATYYRKETLGEWATFVLFDVIDDNGESYPNAEKIIESFKNISDRNLTFEDSKIDFDGEVNLEREIEEVEDLVSELEEEFEESLEEILLNKSRKRVDVDKRKRIKDEVLKLQKKFSNKISRLVDSGKWGDSYEGLVIKLANGTMFKVITDEWKEMKKDFKQVFQNMVSEGLNFKDYVKLSRELDDGRVNELFSENTSNETNLINESSSLRDGEFSLVYRTRNSEDIDLIIGNSQKMDVERLQEEIKKTSNFLMSIGNVNSFMDRKYSSKITNKQSEKLSLHLTKQFSKYFNFEEVERLIETFEFLKFEELIKEKDNVIISKNDVMDKFPSSINKRDLDKFIDDLFSNKISLDNSNTGVGKGENLITNIFSDMFFNRSGRGDLISESGKVFEVKGVNGLVSITNLKPRDFRKNLVKILLGLEDEDLNDLLDETNYRGLFKSTNNDGFIKGNSEDFENFIIDVNNTFNQDRNFHNKILEIFVESIYGNKGKSIIDKQEFINDLKKIKQTSPQGQSLRNKVLASNLVQYQKENDFDYLIFFNMDKNGNYFKDFGIFNFRNINFNKILDLIESGKSNFQAGGWTNSQQTGSMELVNK